MYSQEEVQEIRQRIVVEAKKLLKIPFCHMGNTKYGCDCKGVPHIAYRKAGIEGIPYSDGKKYEPNWYLFTKEDRYLNFFLKYCDWTNFPKIADLVVFRCFKGVDLITHSGIYIGNGDFIHARSGECVKIDNLEHRYWKKCFAGYLVFKPFIGKEIK